MEDESFMPHVENIEERNHLQVEVMKYAMHSRGIREEEWSERFSAPFSELYTNTDIAERFEKVLDENPEDLYEWIQNSLESLTAKGQ